MRKLNRSQQQGAQIGIRLLVLITLVFGIYLVYLTYVELQNEDIDLIRLNWLAIAVLGYLVIVSGFIKAADHGRETHWLFALIGELNSEFTGALVTGILFLTVLAIPTERKAELDLKERLIREMGSQHNGIALQAIRELETKGWLHDGTLSGAYFLEANLQDASLWEAELPGVVLWDANLMSTELIKANLTGADLSLANCRGAFLLEANLSYAGLARTDLRDTSLEFVNFTEADLAEADVTGATFDTNTILPNGSNWSPDTDMARFTDPAHLDYWRSSDPSSPAYERPPSTESE